LKLLSGLTSIALALGISATASAVQIDFTDGTATLQTNGQVDYYEEDGFKLDFIGDGGFISDYYGTGNDVIHAHWLNGCCGSLNQIKVTKNDATVFDLNYFVLTSNTDIGGGPANGTEQTFIHASVDGITSSFSMLLPSENWGFPATQVFLGNQFDNISAFWFTSNTTVDCFGMDNFFIDEEVIIKVPEPAPLSLLLVSLIALVTLRRKKGA
jgi:hypothetical protein